MLPSDDADLANTSQSSNRISSKQGIIDLNSTTKQKCINAAKK